ncbi:MAG: hypothetical protein CL878_11875 [Dehalococcoidia bacterium]|nr:hypothetical protein [Dehalococcoidia bacterium]
MEAKAAARVWPRWLWLNALALAFSLAHLLLDWHVGVFGASSDSVSVLQGGLLVLIAAVYAWWGLSLATAGRGQRSGLVWLLILSAGWAFAGNGLAILACLPPCVFPYGDVTHLGSLVFGGWAAYETWQAMR